MPSATAISAYFMDRVSDIVPPSAGRLMSAYFPTTTNNTNVRKRGFQTVKGLDRQAIPNRPAGRLRSLALAWPASQGRDPAY